MQILFSKKIQIVVTVDNNFVASCCNPTHVSPIFK